TRAAAWGDFDADGDPDLYVGFADGKTRARFYRNDEKGTRFTDVATAIGIELAGVSRQPVWIDYDGDDDLDFFAAFRDKPNRLFRNTAGRFVDVSAESGIDDPRKTVGAVWWDFDQDGDLDVFVANQEGDANGFFRNTGGRFTDVAGQLGVDATGRPKDEGGVGPAVADYDLDGDLDLFVANYGKSALYRNDRGKAFTEVASAVGIDVRTHVTTAAWGDYDADGWVDLYLAGFLADQPHYRDWLFSNGSGKAGERHFTDVLPEVLRTHDATHGVQFVDFDRDGALDLSLTNNDAKGGHYLLRNADVGSARGFSVRVTDAQGHFTRAGAEVRAYTPGTRRLLASGLVDSGSGYCAQSAGPVFLGVPPGTGRVDVEITLPAQGGRTTMTIGNLDSTAFKATQVEARVPVKPPTGKK
ncbi:MAG: VCBS repeat-containing protein, partial [Acidobacteria bacterium]|nr:VCBS repeat-containing protein [Acidobacteriota bacterium]